MVNDLEIPEITLSPYTWTEPDDCISVRSDSFVSDSMDDCRGTLSTDSSIPLSRAMTDSEIDYGRYKRFKSRGFSDPWDHMRLAVDAFPPEYLSSLNSFISTDTEEEIADAYAAERRYRNEELRLKMERLFDEECRVYTPDDPGLLELQDAIRNLDLKALESDLECITVKPPL